jgi:hypothetical protein
MPQHKTVLLIIHLAPTSLLLAASPTPQPSQQGTCVIADSIARAHTPLRVAALIAHTYSDASESLPPPAAPPPAASYQRLPLPLNGPAPAVLARANPGPPARVLLKYREYALLGAGAGPPPAALPPAPAPVWVCMRVYVCVCVELCCPSGGI